MLNGILTCLFSNVVPCAPVVCGNGCFMILCNTGLRKFKSYLSCGHLTIELRDVFPALVNTRAY
jgi:hypothetical protein